MIQVENDRRVILSGKVFLYRQKAPFVPSGKSVLGALEYDQTEDKVRCHECGDWFQNVGVHAAHAHGLRARDYKIRHGLLIKSALVSEGVRVSASVKSPELIAKFVAAGQSAATRAKLAAAERLVGRKSVEKKNESGRCHAQLLFRVQTLATRIGRTPTAVELREAGIHVSSLLVTLNVGSLSAVMSYLGLAPNPSGGPAGVNPSKGRKKYTETTLIELMRDFYAKYARIPRRTDYRRGLLPNESTFAGCFGGMWKCYEAAGLLEEAKRQRATLRAEASRDWWATASEDSKRKRIGSGWATRRRERSALA